ncbi:MAG: hypothetical protein GY814_14930, partial [Gammaproteobacteria bacterium]|nr:hypothetical protein [Gammaproteobacteria bacterium]
ERIIAKSNATTDYIIRINSQGVPVKINACSVFGVNQTAVGFSIYTWNTEGDYLKNVTVRGCSVGFEIAQADLAVSKNLVGYDNATDFVTLAGGDWGDTSNNASEDGTHPGTDGVLITADPFEADGYTPSQGGQLTGMGIDVGVTHGADGKPFALVPAIGAYPAYLPDDSVAPILINPTSEGNFQGLLCKVDSNEATGILFTVATDTATQRTPEQVEAGQDHLGATANDSTFGAVTTMGSQSLVMSNVNVGTTQHVHFVHKDAAGNYSLVVTAASIVVPTYYAQVIYDGMVIPPDSILHLYDGTHTG